MGDSIEEIEERIANMRAAATSAHAVQRAEDMHALEGAMCEHGVDRVAAVDWASWSEGLPTMAIFRTPKKPEFKRFQDTANGKAIAANRDAIHALGLACLLYPTREVFEQMLEQSPGLVTIGGQHCARLAAGQAEEEGKS